MLTLARPYVPPRQAWADGAKPSPLNPAAARPGEPPSVSPSGHRRTSSGDNYYEDIDPRFVEPTPPEDLSMVPTTGLAPGYPHGTSPNNLRPAPLGGMDGNNSYEDIQSGSRSPAESDRSNFTSVSQRGVNPRWNGAQGGYGAMLPSRRPVASQRNDMLLNTNPDFELPSSRGGRGGGPGRGVRAPGQIPGMTSGGPYPGPGAL